jgi:hypothetical protein
MSSHVGAMVDGVFVEKEKVEQEVPDGPQAPSCEVLNPTIEQGKPRCIYRSYRMNKVSCFAYLFMC